MAGKALSMETTDLISQVKAGISSEPQNYLTWKDSARKKLQQFTNVKLSGKFLPHKTLYVHSIRKGVLGYLIFTPFLYQPDKTIFVNRGFVPSHLTETVNQSLQGDIKELEITGLIRLPEEASLFTPEANQDKKIWYIADIQGMKKNVSGEELEGKHYIEIINDNSKKLNGLVLEQHSFTIKIYT